MEKKQLHMMSIHRAARTSHLLQGSCQVSSNQLPPPVLVPGFSFSTPLAWVACGGAGWQPARTGMPGHTLGQLGLRTGPSGGGPPSPPGIQGRVAGKAWVGAPDLSGAGVSSSACEGHCTDAPGRRVPCGGCLGAVPWGHRWCVVGLCGGSLGLPWLWRFLVGPDLAPSVGRLLGLPLCLMD